MNKRQKRAARAARKAKAQRLQRWQNVPHMRSKWCLEGARHAA